MATTPTKRQRRTTEEVRQRLLDAARELFLAHGYEQTYTKDIAQKAGVAEKVLFSNYETKAGLFDAAFVTPFAELADRYIAAWQQGPADTRTAEQRIASFVTGLYELAHKHRTVLRAVLARQTADGQDAHSEIITHIARTIDSVNAIQEHGITGVDQDATTIAVAGMAFGVALLDDMLTASRRPSRKRLEDEMTNLILHGVLHRHEPPPPDPRRSR
jgi:AcrR family transcriptional regulator